MRDLFSRLNLVYIFTNAVLYYLDMLSNCRVNKRLLKIISQIEPRRHRSIWNVTVNILQVGAAYTVPPKKPSLNFAAMSKIND